MDYPRRPKIHVSSGVVVRLPEREDRRVPERQVCRGRCADTFVPGLCLPHGCSTFPIDLRFVFILIHTGFRLRHPLCSNGNECKAILACSLLTGLSVVQRAVKVTAMSLLCSPQYQSSSCRHIVCTVQQAGLDTFLSRRNICFTGI